MKRCLTKWRCVEAINVTRAASPAKAAASDGDDWPSRDGNDLTKDSTPAVIATPAAIAMGGLAGAILYVLSRRCVLQNGGMAQMQELVHQDEEKAREEVAVV
jgi:hypothetical protein